MSIISVKFHVFCFKQNIFMAAQESVMISNNDSLGSMEKKSRVADS
jgi:hypothetical protein